MKRIPSLDGLRAVSILMVIAAHLVPGSADWKGFATLGVRVFFVISGFLITSLLVYEMEATGEVSLRSFYARRSLRIFPLAYFYIGMIALLAFVGAIRETRENLLFAATYMMSYKVQPGGYLPHLWSLSVEEQFYLLWPLALALLGIKNAGRLAIAAIIISPILRAAWWLFLPNQRLSLGYAFPTVIDPLAFGCAAAIYSHKVQRHVRNIPFLAVVLLPVAAWLAMIIPGHMLAGPERGVARFLSDSVIALLLATFTMGAVLNPSARRILSTRPMVYIGVLSYSLYIWQELFASHGANGWMDGTLRLFAIVTCAMAAHYLIEKPFLRLKDRFSVAREPEEALAHAAV